MTKYNSDDALDEIRRDNEERLKQQKAKEALELEELIQRVFGELPRSHTIMRLIKVVYGLQKRVEDLENEVEIKKGY